MQSCACGLTACGLSAVWCEVWASIEGHPQTGRKLKICKATAYPVGRVLGVVIKYIGQVVLPCSKALLQRLHVWKTAKQWLEVCSASQDLCRAGIDTYLYVVGIPFVVLGHPSRERGLGRGLYEGNQVMLGQQRWGMGMMPGQTGSRKKGLTCACSSSCSCCALSSWSAARQPEAARPSNTTRKAALQRIFTMLKRQCRSAAPQAHAMLPQTSVT